MTESGFLLWVDDDEGILRAAERLLRHQFKNVKTCLSPHQALEWLDEYSFALVISDQRMPGMTGLQFLKQVKERQPQAIRILLTGFLEDEVVEGAVNEAGVYRFIVKPWDEQVLLHDVHHAMKHFQDRVSQRTLLREVSTQNRKLEHLKSGLEVLVAERTRHIEESKNKIEQNISNMRRLVLFIKELATLNDLDELLPLFRKELRQFHQVGQPILCYPTPEQTLKIMYFCSRDVVVMSGVAEWSQSLRLRVNQTEDSLYLAHIFSRPFAKVIAVPLGGKRGLDAGISPVIFIEHDLPSEKIEDFLQFLSQRLQPLSVAVDRILLEYQAKYVSFQWEGTFDSIGHPIAIINKNFQLLRANRAFAARRAHSHCFTQFASQKEVCSGCSVHRSLSSKHSESGRVEANGRIYDIYSHPIQMQQDGVFSHIINYYVDVTEARALYSRLVQNEKLSAIGLLAGHIAHELNNPLTGIQSLAQVLMVELKGQDGLPENTLSDLMEVEKAAERSQNIIKNLLDFSNPEATEDVSVVSMNEIVKKTLPLLKTALRDHSSVIELTDQDSRVKVKAALLQQVFFNLVINASHAMDEPGTLLVQTESCVEAETSWVCLHVADTGCGMSVETMSRIFEPFYTTKGEGEGTGLGLSMSHSIIEKYGGKMAVESRLGEGARFSVLLPRVGGGA